MAKEVVDSPCGKYRYALRYSWGAGERALFVLLYPSQTEGLKKTTKRCRDYAKRWGFSEMTIVNLFAHRADCQLTLRHTADPIGPDNDTWLGLELRRSNLVIAGWGTGGYFKRRADEVLKMHKHWHCLVTDKRGYPRPPLFLSASLDPIPY